MITLEELLEKCKILGLSDLKIIELYFIENGIEDKGVELMNSLSQRQIKLLHEKNSFFKEDLEYCKAVLYNEMNEEDKMRLFNLVCTFTYYRDLDAEELNLAKKIFENNEIHVCPIYFIAYLVEKGVLDKKVYSYQKDMLEGVIKRRD